MNLVQLDLFRDVDEIGELRKQIQQVADSSANVRRGLFARHTEMAKVVLELYNEVLLLKEELGRKSG